MSNPSIMIYVPFALNGNKNTIQVARQANQDQEDATWGEGFPDVTMIKQSAGGLAPKGLDINGILFAISSDTVHRQSGKQIQYDSAYAANIGGYSKGSVVQSTDESVFWISTVDNNLTDPDSTSRNGWNRFAYTPLATLTTTGTVKLADTLDSTAIDTALTANQGRILSNNTRGNTLETGSRWIGDTLMQWGNGSGKDGDFFYFNQAFPNGFLVLTVTDNNFYSSNGYNRNSSTKAGFVLKTGANLLTFSYIAIGY